MADRRKVFRILAGEGLALLDEWRGRPQYRSNDLAECPSELLARIVPRIEPGIFVDADENGVYARKGEQGDLVYLFVQSPENRFIFNRINGRNPIARITAELSQEFAEDESTSFERVRGLFLSLAALGVCSPVNDPAA